MQNKSPLVSVIIPCFNRELTLSKTIDSVISQTYENIEILIVDDGSTDTSPEIINRYAAQHPYTIKPFTTKNSGPYAARNLALEHASGDLIAFLDSDDYWDKKKIARQVEIFIEHPDLGLVHTCVVQIDEWDNVFKYSNSGLNYSGHCLRKLLIYNGIATSSVMVPKPVFEAVGNFNEKYPARGDWEMWTRISHSYPIYYIEDYLTYYRVHSGMMSTDYSRMKRFHLMIIEDNREQYKGVLSDIDNLTDEAEFVCHLSYANGAVSRGDFLFAAKCFFLAIKSMPFKFTTYPLAIYGILKAAIKKMYFKVC